MRNGAALSFGGDNDGFETTYSTFTFGDRRLSRYNSSNSWFTVFSPQAPQMRKRHVFIYIAPGLAFLYGGECVANGNLLP